MGRIRVPDVEYPAWIIFAWALVFLLTISSCTVAPVRNRTEIIRTLPMQFNGHGTIDADKPMLWVESFPSEFLQADIQTLIGENFELKAAYARVAQAAADYGIARSDRFPSLETKADADRSRVKEDEPDCAETTRNTIAFEAALSWELDIWGRLKTKQAAAALSFREKQALVDQTALDLETLLVESWVTHHAARKLKQVLRQQQKTNIQILELTELRFAQGQGSALDILQQRGRLATIESTLPEVDADQCRAANAYAVLMGRLPDGGNLMDDQWPVLKPLTALITPRRMMLDRPDLRAAFLALQAADHEMAAAIADRLPRLSIGWTAAGSGHSLSRIGDGSVFRIAGGLLAPIFDAGRFKAKTAQREAKVNESLAVLEQTMRKAVREVEDTLAQEVALFEEQRLLQEQIAIAMDTVEEATMRYANGQKSFLAVLSALVEQQTLQQNKITLQQELLINRGYLLKALGAKWSR